MVEKMSKVRRTRAGIDPGCGAKPPSPVANQVRLIGESHQGIATTALGSPDTIPKPLHVYYLLWSSAEMCNVPTVQLAARNLDRTSGGVDRVTSSEIPMRCAHSPEFLGSRHHFKTGQEPPVEACCNARWRPGSIQVGPQAMGCGVSNQGAEIHQLIDRFSGRGE